MVHIDMFSCAVILRMINNTYGVMLAFVIFSVLLTHYAQAEPEEQQAYYLRGKQIEQLYESHTQSLNTAFERLQLLVENNRPDLLSKLKKPERRRYGYQLIPQILPDEDAACTDTSTVAQEKPYRPKSNRFSWTITETRINKEISKLTDQLEPDLLSFAEIPESEVRAQAINTMVETYLELRKQHRFLDEMIQHNWLWQKEVSLRTAKFDKSTLIHDAVVERTMLLEVLATDNKEDYEKAIAKTNYAETKFATHRTELSNRITELDQQIHTSSNGLTPRDYIRLEQLLPHRWVFHIPVNTDIEDDNFLQEFKEAVENRWCLRNGEDEYRVQMDLRKLSATELYGDELEDGDKTKVPAKAEQIDLVAHCRKFPTNAARLSSGAKKTYIRAGCMFVGPEDVKASTLVHEFGHLLGFADEYVRGYRDLKTEGYEIVEILPDGNNIMANSGRGDIQLLHFSALLAGTYFRTGFAAAKIGDHAAAVIAYRKTIEISGDPSNMADAYNNLGWSLNQLGKYEEAVIALLAAIKMRPDRSLPRNNLKVVRDNLKR